MQNTDMADIANVHKNPKHTCFSMNIACKVQQKYIFATP
jgi:hypothetical protein